MGPPASDRVSRVRSYSGSTLHTLAFRLRDLYPLWSDFPDLFDYTHVHVIGVLNPKDKSLVWPLPRSLAATRRIDVSFFSSGYLDVSVPRVPFHTLCIGVWIHEVRSCGFPHSDISGSLDICSSPKLFAAYHVFHRLLVPRHPPYALNSITN